MRTPLLIFTTWASFWTKLGLITQRDTSNDHAEPYGQKRDSEIFWISFDIKTIDTTKNFQKFIDNGDLSFILNLSYLWNISHRREIKKTIKNVLFKMDVAGLILMTSNQLKSYSQDTEELIFIIIKWNMWLN